MKVRFQADNDLRSAIRKGVIRREPSIDFQSAKAANLEGLQDREVLQHAMRQGRILVSHDVNSMPDHFNRFLAAGNSSPGLLLAPQGAPNDGVIESILLIWLASDSDEWVNRVEWLPL